jgi:FkbH-like protein
MSARTYPHWLSVPHELDAAFAQIKASADPSERLRRIIALAQFRLDFLQIAKLDRALERTLVELPEPPGLQTVRIAWLGSATLDHLLPSARIACLRAGIALTHYVAPYGQYRQELLDPGSELARFRPHIVFLSLDPEHVALDLGVGLGQGGRASLGLDAGRDAVAARVRDWVGELAQLWKLASERLGAVVIQETIPNLAPRLFGSFDAMVPGSPAAALDRVGRELVDAASAARVALVDLAAWSARLGHDAWFDPVRWFQAKQLVSPAMAPLHGELVARQVAAIRGRARKCLVLDLDNTLWGGVVGDDGVERLVLGQGSAAGEAFVRFQRYVQRLKDRGIVLAVCSKNEAAIAEAAFATHPEMVLRRDDIAVFVANWSDKASNLRSIAESLNLGLDALVFFDDNPAERALVRGELAMVAVPEVPDDPAYFVQTLEDAGYFEAVSFTSDDLARARQYQDNGRRATAFESATDMDSFLRGLEMAMQIAPVDDQSLARVTQLVNKTNQFNVTTRRYTEPEMRAFIADPKNVALHVRLADRFGDNGLIAVVLARPDGPRQLAIDSLLMSCRVLGRGAELAIMNALVGVARARAFERVIGEYIATAKNAMVSDLFRRLGFEPLTGGTPKATQWTLSVAEYRPHPHFITVGAAT